MVVPRISILIPAWNAEHTLGRALASVRRQSMSDWHCVVVDDGSDDQTRAVARRFVLKDHRFELLCLPHRGLVESLNSGLEQCRGALLARFDADDVMHEHRLARQCEHLDREPELDAVGCHVRLFPRPELKPKRIAYETWLNSLQSSDEVFRDRFVECPVAHPSLTIRRECLSGFGYADRGWPEDYDLVLRVLGAGRQIAVTPAPLLRWRDGSTRLSRSSTTYALERFVACKAHYLAGTWLQGETQYLLWGYGDTGRNLCRALASLGKHPAAIIELDPRKLGQTIQGAKVIAPQAIRSHAERHKIVISVSGQNARSDARLLASGLGLREGSDFVCAA